MPAASLGVARTTSGSEAGKGRHAATAGGSVERVGEDREVRQLGHLRIVCALPRARLARPDAGDSAQSQRRPSGQRRSRPARSQRQEEDPAARSCRAGTEARPSFRVPERSPAIRRPATLTEEQQIGDLVPGPRERFPRAATEAAFAALKVLREPRRSVSAGAQLVLAIAPWRVPCATAGSRSGAAGGATAARDREDGSPVGFTRQMHPRLRPRRSRADSRDRRSGRARGALAADANGLSTAQAVHSGTPTTGDFLTEAAAGPRRRWRQPAPIADQASEEAAGVAIADEPAETAEIAETSDRPPRPPEPVAEGVPTRASR